jgi:Bacterial Ig-like domain (group 1).
MTATAFGYNGQVLGTMTISGPGGTLKCGVALTVTATLLDVNGNPFTGESVTWKFTSSPSTADKINKTPTTTNSNGVTTTTVTLACVAGDRTVTATSGETSAGAVLSVTSAGLPRTSTLPDSGPAGELPIGTIFAFLAVLVGGGIIVRRVASSPR